MGFKLSPYDPCVANKIINGSQSTICWYVDDNKISHKNSKVVNNIIKKLEQKYGKMTTTRESEHNFLGMGLKCKGKKVSINMKNIV